jgi:hypothetical protein
MLPQEVKMYASDQELAAQAQCGDEMTPCLCWKRPLQSPVASRRLQPMPGLVTELQNTEARCLAMDIRGFEFFMYLCLVFYLRFVRHELAMFVGNGHARNIFTVNVCFKFLMP